MAPSLGRGCWRLKTASCWRRGEVFEHQTAARPKPAKHGSDPEPKQVQHGNQVIALGLSSTAASSLRKNNFLTSNTRCKDANELSRIALSRTRFLWVTGQIRR